MFSLTSICNRMREIATYIIGGQLNATAFYESLPLLDDNYWSRYKHYFVRDVDSESFASINTFYDYVSEVQEQQSLVKRLQKKHFELAQSTVINIESQIISEYLANQGNSSCDKSIVSALDKTIPSGLSDEEKTALHNACQKAACKIPVFDTNSFLNAFTPKRIELLNLINMNILTPYTPLQISSSLEKILKAYSMLTIVGNDGYRKIKSISKKRI